MRRIFPGDKIRWRDDLLEQDQVLPMVLDEYRRWTQDIVSEHKESPLGYTEWALCGHLAIAADKLDYYTLQDYCIQPKPRPTEVPNRRRPDLYVKVDDEHDYVFEVKGIGINLRDNESRITGKFKVGLRHARDKLDGYKSEARHPCTLVVAFIWMEIDDWVDKYRDPPSYRQRIFKLRESLQHVLDSLPRGMANFCGGFACTHKEASAEYDRARKHNWSPFPVGVALMGHLKPHRRPGK